MALVLVLADTDMVVLRVTGKGNTMTPDQTVVFDCMCLHIELVDVDKGMSTLHSDVERHIDVNE